MKSLYDILIIIYNTVVCDLQIILYYIFIIIVKDKIVKNTADAYLQ